MNFFASTFKVNQSALAVLLCVLSFTAQAQNAQRSLQNYRVHDGVIEIITNDGKYQLTPYSESIVEASFIPNGEAVNPISHAVVLTPTAQKIQVTANVKEISFATGGINVIVTKAPFSIAYFYHGRKLISEQQGYAKDERGETLSFNLDSEEALYGAGARALGMDRRGNRLPLYNKAHYGYEDHSTQMNFGIPLVLSSRIYAVHFDNAAIGYLDLDSHKQNVLTYETISGRKTYQVIAADNWEQLVANYTSLTGHQPLPPRWAFGNFASRFGYHSEQQARAIVEEFRKEQIPLDAIIFDLYWFGKDIKGTMGNLEFDPDNFPNPGKMIADFKDQGVKTVLITEPFILTTSKKWDEAVAKKVLATDKQGAPYAYDFYFGHTGLIDIFKPQAQDWFWAIYKKYIQLGVAGWWGDLGEPEVHPSDLQHATGSADELHNIYGHNWAKLLADGYQKDFPAQRPFILMRAGYAGSQRFGMIPWSGDVNRTWGGLQSQPEIALQMGMQGMAYMHSDLGGFAGVNVDDELYTRWLQYGVFQPIFRPHAQEEVAAEPVLREPTTMQRAKAAIELRYQMLPYNYTLGFENSQTGLPLMRPLMFEEPHNKALAGVANSYLWGHELLIKPVLHPGETSTFVYFPASANWFDFYTDQAFKAGTTEKIDVTPEHIPVFVRAGAFIPLIDVIQNTELYSTSAFKLHYYHDPSVTSSAGHLYDDDGKTPDSFAKQAYSLLSFTSKFVQYAAGSELRLSLNEVDGAGYPSFNRKVNLIVHHIERQPLGVVLKSSSGATPLEYRWDKDKHIVTAQVDLSQSAPIEVIVKLGSK